MKACVVLDAMMNMAKVVNVADDADILKTLYQLIDCDTVELVSLYPDRIPDGYVALCDEDTYGKTNIFNPLASWLHGADEHGQFITRNVVILKEVPDDFDFMTEEEAQSIAEPLNDRAEQVFMQTMESVMKIRSSK